MSIKWINRVWECEHLKDKAETLVLLALADWANDDGEAYPALVQLAKKSRVSKRGLLNILSRLKGVYLEWEDNDGGRNIRNKYKLLKRGLKGEPASPFIGEKKGESDSLLTNEKGEPASPFSTKERGKTQHEKGEPRSQKGGTPFPRNKPSINHQYNHQEVVVNTQSFNLEGNEAKESSENHDEIDLRFLNEKESVYEPTIRDVLKQYPPAFLMEAYTYLLKGDHRRATPTASVLALRKKYGHVKLMAALVLAGSENRGGAGLKYVEGFLKRWNDSTSSAPANGTHINAGKDYTGTTIPAYLTEDMSFLDEPLTE